MDITFICKNGLLSYDNAKEEANEQDPYAVAIMKRTAGHRTKVVCHLPRGILAACTLFLQ